MKYEQNQLPLVFLEPVELATENGVMLPVPDFEDFATDLGEGKNPVKTWWASEFAVMLGYPDLPAIIKPLNRARTACYTIDIACDDDFKKETRIVDDVVVEDFRLTRFACYMIAMNADARKEPVAKAQFYFVKLAEHINLGLQGSVDVDRIIIRDSIKEGNKSLASAAKQSGVTKFGIFIDCGYKGLYNMSQKSVAAKKGVKSEHLLDYMGRTELSANLFRITMTEERLKKDNIKNETRAYQVHKEIGQTIRATVIENTGMAPEQLPLERRLTEASKALKNANKRLSK